MAQLAKFRNLLGSALWPALSIMLLLVFVAYAIFGPNGVLAWGDYARQRQVRQAEFDRLTVQEAALRNRVNLVARKGVDPDMAEQLARERLGVTHPDEVIMLLQK
jgi:cell division protein FtsB